MRPVKGRQIQKWMPRDKKAKKWQLRNKRLSSRVRRNLRAYLFLIKLTRAW